MSRTKGTPKTGGRKAGTPNRVTGTLKEFVSNLIDQNMEQIEFFMKAELFVTTYIITNCQTIEITIW